jgi:hypothetical protein
MSDKNELPRRDPGAALPRDEQAQLIMDRESRRLADEQKENDR